MLPLAPGDGLGYGRREVSTSELAEHPYDRAGPELEGKLAFVQLFLAELIGFLGRHDLGDHVGLLAHPLRVHDPQIARPRVELIAGQLIQLRLSLELGLLRRLRVEIELLLGLRLGRLLLGGDSLLGPLRGTEELEPLGDDLVPLALAAALDFPRTPHPAAPATRGRR